jgi:3-hydroxymyristoyl/3-hydroxydecanoyl-(acyl carrier protein) dehydratase
VAALREAATAHLADRFDRALLPRAWRVVARLPRNASGKLPAAALRALFESPREPLVVCEERAAGVLQRQLELPAELACCDGHFPGEAIVPGVTLLGWALRAGAELAGRELALASIDALKFPEPLRPGQRCSLRVALRADGGRLDFEIRAGATTCASGRCTLAAEASI